ncbi:hypothetical protein ONZ51_g1803 [Trametes cubensis]|uniref:DUF6533 domain-containing protein n=1 Tax=Trametes cubensis TaxID=1111947 RepID=A0AAD7U338_9APHY|nr:hypothetical protein ONZ51_g1803 [Trametes cubensis]
MSTSADPATVSEVASTTTTDYCFASAPALLVYYYLTTLDEEFKHYSKRKFTLATLLYVTNRYIPLVYNVYAAPWVPGSSQEKICKAEGGIEYWLEQLQYFPWAIFSALRTYALQRKLYWAAVVLILSLAPMIVNGRRHRSVPVLARVPVIIADIIVIYITWKTQYKLYGLGKDLPTPMRLTTVLLYDGTVYFVVLTVLDILLLIFEYLQVWISTQNFKVTLTTILVSEFLNDLHEAADKMSGSGSLSSVSDLEFRIVGSIGASLPAPSDDGTPDEAEEGGRENPEGSETEDGQNSEAVSSGAELEIEEVPRGEAEV